MKLTQEQKQIKIAEACGWKRTILPEPMRGSCDPTKGIVFCKWEHPTLMPVDNDPGHDPWHAKFILPRYFSDLNAMHEAWTALSQSNWEVFEGTLESIITGNAEWHENDDRPLVTNATAAQRAEAFGLTLNLWTE